MACNLTNENCIAPAKVSRINHPHCYLSLEGSPYTVPYPEILGLQVQNRIPITWVSRCGSVLGDSPLRIGANKFPEVACPCHFVY